MTKPQSKKSTSQQTLTKADISTAVHREIGLSKSESTTLVTSCLNQVAQALMSGENVKLANFGTFKLTHKKARYGRNPKTGEEALVSERTVVTYKASPHVAERINSASKRKKL